MSEKSYETVVEFVNNKLSETGNIAICGIFRGRGGASRVIEQQAIDLMKAGYDVTIFALEADMVPPDDVDIYTINPFQKYGFLSKVYWIVSPFSPWLVFNVLNLASYDMAIVHRYPYTIPGYLISRFSDTDYVYWSHPSGDSSSGFSGLASIVSSFTHSLETSGRVIEGADHICAVSNDSRQYLKSKINHPVHIIPNKINQKRFCDISKQEVVYEEYGLSEEDRVVLFVGRITERKNIHSLIEIFEDITSEHDGIKLVIIGSESQEGYADKVKRAAGENVVFTGYVPDEDLGAFYSLADAFATCSLEEGWGLPITEAQHFDTPIVAFNSHPAAKRADEKILVDEENYEEFKEALSDILNQG